MFTAFEVLGAFGHENINQLSSVAQTPDVWISLALLLEAVVGFVRERAKVHLFRYHGFLAEQLSELKQLGRGAG